MIAGVVAERVVDVLEAVQVQEQQGHLLPLALRLGQGVLQAVVEQGPVGQVGQGVVEGEVIEAILPFVQPGLGQQAVRDVLHQSHGVNRPPVVIEDPAAGEMPDHGGAVLAQVAFFEITGFILRDRCLFEAHAGMFPILRVGDVHYGQGLQFRLGVSQQPAQGGIDLQDLPRRGVGIHPRAAMVEDRAEALFARSKRLLRAFDGAEMRGDAGDSGQHEDGNGQGDQLRRLVRRGRPLAGAQVKQGDAAAHRHEENGGRD